jgi:hypothetical protein
MIASYESELVALPKGSLVCKKVKNHEYIYLQFRKGKKTVSASATLSWSRATGGKTPNSESSCFTGLLGKTKIAG